ncbi:MAG: hypothetical protein ACOYL6_01965 [Bacteriovoracaceae bacterium]
MSTLRLKKSLLTLTLIFVIAGCTAVNDEAPKSDILGGSSIPQLCKIDSEAFKNITKYDISGDLNCLRDNFNQFISSVESARPGYLYRKDLQKFIARYFNSDVTNLTKGIDTLFQINFLLVGDEEEYISRKQLNRLVDLMVTFNSGIIQVYRYYEDKSNRSDSMQAAFRLKIESVSTEVATQVQEIIKERSDVPASLDLMSVLKNFIDSDISLNKIKVLLFAKKMFFGGNKNLLTNVDMKRVIDNLPQIAGIAFDLIQIGHVNFYDPNGVYEYIDNNVKDVQKLLYFSENSQEILFTLDELAKASVPFKEDFVDLTKYPNTLFELKKMLVDTPNPAEEYNKHIRAKDLTAILNHVYHVLDEGIHFAKFSVYYADLINMPGQISHPMNDYPVTNETEQKYLNHYRSIVQKYRFYKGSFEAPYYANRYYRNARGLNEVAMIEYALTLLMNFHGKPVDNTPALNVEQILGVVKRFRDLLLDKEIIIQGREVASSENALLLSNLFQYQSNGNKTLDLPEATEFAYTLISGIGIGDYIKNEMTTFCKPSGDGQIEITCFQKNFFNVLRSKYGQSFPKLYQFIDENANNQSKVDELINVTARFARVCPDNPTFSRNDMVAVLGGLLNVESTLIRFDRNLDNKLDYPELLNAFDVYRGSIESLVDKDDETHQLKKFSKEIFLFLVKYNKMPGKNKVTGENTTGKFLLFLLENKKGITGDRTTIANILRNLGVLAKYDRENNRHIYDPVGLCKGQ